MKKKILLIFILAIFGLSKANAFTVAFINGTVTNTLTSMPAVAHTVIITDSINYTQLLYTDINGFYHDSIGNSSPNPIKYYILIYDCNNILHYDTVTTTGYVSKTANFSICYNFIDAGVTDIITPTNPVMVGDILPLKVKFKNYSTQSINSLQIGFIINGQLLSPFNWVGVLYPDSSAIIQIGTYTVPNQNNLYLISYTNLSGDMNHNNDTCFKTQLIVPLFDAGVTDILYPSDTVAFGDTIAPKIIFKNYGTIPITSLQLGYILNNNTVAVLETWNGNLFPDSSAIYTFNQKYYLDSLNLYRFRAFLFHPLDNNSLNNMDSVYVCMLPPTNDAGVTEIIMPSNITAGDTIYPVVKFKNYGSLSLTNVSLKLVMNGYYNNPINWTGNLPHDSSTTIPFGQFIISNLYSNFVSYTIINNDLNHFNDTCYKIINVNPAQIDAGIVEIISPADVTCSGVQTYPKVVIKNFGTNPLTSIPLSCQRGSSTIVTGNWTRLIPLNYGDTVHFTFATPFNVPIGTSYAFSAFTTLANDANPINNKVAKSVIIGIPPPTTFNIIGDDTVIIGQSNVAYYADCYAYYSYQYIWTLPPGAVIDTVYNNYIVINYGSNAQSGNITCKIMNACGISQTVVLPISVFATPPPPIIYQTGNTLNSGYSTGNQWYFNNVAIAGATQPTYIPTNTGYYYCMVTINGSSSYASNSIYVAITGIEDAYIKSHFMVYPNPFTDKTNFKYSLNKSTMVNLKITDMEGRIIRTLVSEEQSMGEYTYQLNANNLSKGIYIYTFYAGNATLNGKLIITE